MRRNGSLRRVPSPTSPAVTAAGAIFLGGVAAGFELSLDQGSDRRHRNLARPPIFIGFQLAARDALVNPIPTLVEDPRRRTRADDERFDVRLAMNAEAF